MKIQIGDLMMVKIPVLDEDGEQKIGLDGKPLVAKVPAKVIGFYKDHDGEQHVELQFPGAKKSKITIGESQLAQRLMPGKLIRIESESIEVKAFGSGAPFDTDN